jgi:hypothetical protein
MKNYSQLFLTLTLVAIFALTACGTQQPAANPSTVPNSLVTIEAAAEDIIDFAPSRNWDKINADVTDIENAWKSYQPQADQAGASQKIQNAMISALAELEAAAASKDGSATMQGSNDVSAAVVELFALYSPKVPADIGRLDVLERQVILDVAAKDYTAAEKSLAKTKSVWEEVKPLVLDHNGKDVAAQFEASLTAQESALTAKDDASLTNEARDGLEIVDALEQLY